MTVHRYVIVGNAEGASVRYGKDYPRQNPDHEYECNNPDHAGHYTGTTVVVNRIRDIGRFLDTVCTTHL